MSLIAHPCGITRSPASAGCDVRVCQEIVRLVQNHDSGCLDGGFRSSIPGFRVVLGGSDGLHATLQQFPSGPWHNCCRVSGRSDCQWAYPLLGMPKADGPQVRWPVSGIWSSGDHGRRETITDHGRSATRQYLGLRGTGDADLFKGPTPKEVGAGDLFTVPYEPRPQELGRSLRSLLRSRPAMRPCRSRPSGPNRDQRDGSACSRRWWPRSRSCRSSCSTACSWPLLRPVPWRQTIPLDGRPLAARRRPSRAVGRAIARLWRGSGRCRGPGGQRQRRAGVAPGRGVVFLEDGLREGDGCVSAAAPADVFQSRQRGCLGTFWSGGWRCAPRDRVVCRWLSPC